uniref:Uncharacterized protein n=1 Tax=Coccidioides posadasii RMSCC 3488 TaxID=454284 RepID=A0A0J6IK62_COCPO|nr:hypothetical protein CPAG_08619 [Coccidioides posadasii RMSCC 3488]
MFALFAPELMIRIPQHGQLSTRGKFFGELGLSKIGKAVVLDYPVFLKR